MNTLRDNYVSADQLSLVESELAQARSHIRKLETCMRLLVDHLVREGGWSKPIGEAMKEALQ